MSVYMLSKYLSCGQLMIDCTDLDWVQAMVLVQVRTGLELVCSGAVRLLRIWLQLKMEIMIDNISWSTGGWAAGEEQL